jgi:hypothetical protein
MKCSQTRKAKRKLLFLNTIADYAQYLINVFREENFPNGNLSENAESALSFLFNLLLPKKAVKLDEDYLLDPELLLLAVYRAYRDNFVSFNGNWDQLDAFCIRVIGLIQSVLAPETGKILCEGLDYVVAAEEKGIKKEISRRAKEHKLRGGESFYRSARDSHDGVGASYLAYFLFGGCLAGSVCPWDLRLCGAEVWKNHVKQKHQVFGTLRDNHHHCEVNTRPTINNRVV